MTPTLGRRGTSEAVGTALLVAIVVGSGAHFNPVVTIADRVFGGMTTREAFAYIPAQVVGACAGAASANVMFDLDPITLSTRARFSDGLWVGEVVATFGLVLVILGVVRSGRAATAPFAVAGYIAAILLARYLHPGLPAIDIVVPHDHVDAA